MGRAPRSAKAAHARREPKARKRAPVLTDQLRAEIVTRLATYETVYSIHTDLAERGIDISHQAVSSYNPENSAGGSKLAAKWVALFHASRAAFIEETAKHGVAHRTYRLRELQRLYERASQAALAGGEGSLDALKEARATLEQAAKEVGDVFTNVTKATGKVDHSHLHVAATIDEKRNMLADRLREATMKLLPAPAKGGG